MSFEPLASVLSDVRTFVRNVCVLNDVGSMRAENFVLVANELATNSVVHGGSTFRVDLWVNHVALRVEVSDGSSVMPVLDAGSRGTRREGAHGRGLQIVDRVADSWGVLPLWDVGKVVWAKLPAV